MDEVKYTYIKGGKIITEIKEKWELISSHIARRSLVTNVYLSGRLKTYEIMDLTGYTTEKSFFRYVKINQENIIEKLLLDPFF